MHELQPMQKFRKTMKLPLGILARYRKSEWCGRQADNLKLQNNFFLAWAAQVTWNTIGYRKRT